MKSVHASFLILLAAAATVTAATPDFDVQAVYEPPAKGAAQGAVAVTFSPLNPDVKINEEPAPRLVLASAQVMLDDKQPPAKPGTVADPENAKTLDLTKPVRFAVAPRAGAPAGEQTVLAQVTYFYCSKREGWCKKGKTPVEFPVKVR